MSARITAYYRKHDDFRRYTAASKERIADLSRLYRKTKRYFGRKVLDLACGGGAFGSVLEPEGHQYVGVDSNPDMIRSARDNARKTRSSNRFILGDVRSAGIEGRFNTVTLLGNALCHFDTADFLSIITNVERNVQARSYFIVDYRDVVSLLFAGKWARRFSEKRGGRTVTSLTKGIDTEQGILLLESVQKHGRNFDFTHGVWSPFVIEPLMRAKGWRLARRYPLRAWNGWLDVYEKE